MHCAPHKPQRDSGVQEMCTSNQGECRTHWCVHDLVYEVLADQGFLQECA